MIVTSASKPSCLRRSPLADDGSRLAAKKIREQSRPLPLEEHSKSQRITVARQPQLSLVEDAIPSSVEPGPHFRL